MPHYFVSTYNKLPASIGHYMQGEHVCVKTGCVPWKRGQQKGWINKLIIQSYGTTPKLFPLTIQGIRFFLWVAREATQQETGNFEVKFIDSYTFQKGRVKHSKINHYAKYTHEKWQPFNSNTALFSTEGHYKTEAKSWRQTNSNLEYRTRVLQQGS